MLFKILSPSITLLNFTKSARRRHIMSSGRTVAYLPTEFGCLHSSQEMVPRSQAEKKSCPKVLTLQALYKGIEVSLAPLQNVALRDVVCETRLGKKYFFTWCWNHMLPIFQKPKICSESKNWLERQLRAKLVNWKAWVLISYSLLLENFVTNANSILVELPCTKKRFAEENKIDELSMLPFLPEFHTFSFIAAHPSVDVYANSRSETINTLSLGIGGLLMECLLNYPDDWERVSNTVPTKKVLS